MALVQFAGCSACPRLSTPLPRWQKREAHPGGVAVGGGDACNLAGACSHEPRSGYLATPLGVQFAPPWGAIDCLNVNKVKYPY